MEGGFWWGFFLWIIGIIVVAVRPNDAKKQEEYMDNTPHIFYCPNCNKTYSGISGKYNDTCPDCNELLLEASVLRDVWQKFSSEKKSEYEKGIRQWQVFERLSV